MDERGFQLWGLPQAEDVTFEDLSAHIHPADRDRVRNAFSATRAVVGAYETDFRIMIGDEVKWISARGQGDDADIRNGVMFGIFLDVTGRKQAEEANELLAGEMSHRVKNLLAIAAGLTAITSRSTTTTEEMARELTMRLTALGAAHDLVRRCPAARHGRAAGRPAVGAAAALDDLGAFSGRVGVSVPENGVGRPRRRAGDGHPRACDELAQSTAPFVRHGTLDVSCTAKATRWSSSG
jgi:hypothetical protein